MRIVKSFEFWVASFLIVMLVMHDFVFLSIYELFGSNFYLNMWKEVVFFSFFFVWFCWGILARWVGRAWITLVFVFFTMLIMSIFFGDMSEGALRTLRSFYIPVFFGLMLSRLFLSLDPYLIGRLIDNVILIGFAVCCYAAYQYFFIKEMNDFWYVGPLVAQGFDIVEHNSFRNGAVRISGFFTSSLEFSFFVLFNLMVLLARNFYRKQFSMYTERNVAPSYFNYLCVFVFIAAISFSTVRSAQVGLVVSLFYYYFAVGFGRSKPIALFISGVALAVFLVSLTFAYIYFGYTSDLSVLGRVRQWSEVLDRLVENPFGMGLGFVGPGQDKWYDSLLLNMLSAIGLVTVPILCAILFCYYMSCVLYCQYVKLNNYVGATLALPVVSFFPVFIYLCFFQALYNAQVLYLFFVFMFSLFFGLRKHDEGF